MCDLKDVLVLTHGGQEHRFIYVKGLVDMAQGELRPVEAG